MSYTIWPDGPTGEILEQVNRERLRQYELKERGKFKFTCSDEEITHLECLAVLTEEVGEAAHEVNETIGEAKRLNRRKLKLELIQIAAVAVGWAEKVEREGG